MPVYNLSPIFNPQYVPNAAAALTMAPPGFGTTVAAGYQVRIDTLRVVNKTSAPVSLKLWLVPSGATNDDEHIVTVPTVLVPVGVSTFPQFDATALWGETLMAGAAVWALAGAANSLSIHGSGLVVQL